MLPLQLLSKLINIIRSGASPKQIAGGFIIGMTIGMLPDLINLTNLVLFFILIIINVNIATALFSILLFSTIAYLADPLLHSLGYLLLAEFSFLREIWTWMYHTPFIPYSRYNNTVVMGSYIVSLILLFPMYQLVKFLIVKYREKYEPRVKNLKWIKFIKGTSLYRWYERLKFLGD